MVLYENYLICIFMNINENLKNANKTIGLFGTSRGRRDVPVGVPLDISTPTGMGCIGTYGENFKSDNVSKYRVL